MSFMCFILNLASPFFTDELESADDGRRAFPDYEATARLIGRPEVMVGGVSYWDDLNTPMEEDAGLTIAASHERDR